jgi:hypothetical protein
MESLPLEKSKEISDEKTSEFLTTHGMKITNPTERNTNILRTNDFVGLIDNSRYTVPPITSPINPERDWVEISKTIKKRKIMRLTILPLIVVFNLVKMKEHEMENKRKTA